MADRRSDGCKPSPLPANAKFSHPASLAVAVACGVSLLAGSAWADDGLDLQQLHAMPGQTTNFFGAATGDTSHHLHWDVSLFANYGHNPLVLVAPDGESSEPVLAGQLATSLLFNIGLFDRFELGIDLPVALHRTGEVAQGPPLGLGDGGFGIGDLRVVPKAQLFSNRDHPGARGMALALVGEVWAPLGDGASFQGGELRGAARLAYDVVTHGGQQMAINIGYLARPSSTRMNMEINDMITWSVAASQPVHPDLRLVAEVSSKMGYRSSDFSRRDMPLEALAGAKYHNGGLFVQGGAGAGLVSGYGTPDFRAFLGVGYAAAQRPQWETLDEPEPTPEFVPECTLETVAEDCPDLPEDHCTDGVVKSFSPACAEGECGVVETTMTCAAGTVCGEEDGVPACVPAPMCEADQDCDEVPAPRCEDATLTTFTAHCDAGACHYEPTDEDCPESFLCGLEGGVPACVEEPEEELVQVDEESQRIELSETIYFASNSDEIEDRSLPLLNQIARIIRENPQIESIRVEGHTDNRGARDHNVDLSQRRAQAVVQALVDRGVEDERLNAEGFGPDQPITTNASEAGRSANRRVELHIVSPD